MLFINGSLRGKFTLSRGLCQGDHLSPFLFIMGAEFLSRLITKEELRGNLHGIKICRQGPPISHLLFADDIVIFSRATSNGIATVLSYLNKYSVIYGQKVNFAKSTILQQKLQDSYSTSNQWNALALSNSRERKIFGAPSIYPSKKENTRSSKRWLVGKPKLSPRQLELH